MPGTISDRGSAGTFILGKICFSRYIFIILSDEPYMSQLMAVIQKDIYSYLNRIRYYKIC